MEVPAIERGLLRLWHNRQIKGRGNKIIEIGCNESLCATTLSKLGNLVVGIDVKPFQPNPYGTKHEFELNFKFIQGDASVIRFDPTFDLGIAISSVEHFGCGEYGDIKDDDSDIKAMVNLWHGIVPRGVVIMTVPISDREFYTELGYIRKYDKQALKDRIIQGNKIQRFEIVTHPNGPDFVGGPKAFETFDFSDIPYSADIYLEMVKGD